MEQHERSIFANIWVICWLLGWGIVPHAYHSAIRATLSFWQINYAHDRDILSIVLLAKLYSSFALRSIPKQQVWNNIDMPNYTPCTILYIIWRWLHLRSSEPFKRRRLAAIRSLICDLVCWLLNGVNSFLHAIFD